MISAKAGLVNYVDGQTNVRLHEQVLEGAPIETQAQGHVEVLLTPGSFLRLGNDSIAVLDSVELDRVAIRLLEGTALIEVGEVDKHTPIRVTSGNLRAMISKRGIYRFSGNTASVIDGKLEIVDQHKTVKKGYQITSNPDSYVANTFINTSNDDLDRWSQSRSAALANANALAYNDRAAGTYSTLGYYPYWDVYGGRSSWIYSSLLGGFTFIPLHGYRSYYGYSFVPAPVFAARPGFATRPGTPVGGPVRSGSTAGSNTSVSRPRPGGGGFHAPAGGHSPGLRPGGARSGGHGHR
jgi:hypothetical protein